MAKINMVRKLISTLQNKFTQIAKVVIRLLYLCFKKVQTAYTTINKKLRLIIKILFCLVFLYLTAMFFIPLSSPLFPDDYSLVIYSEDDVMLRAFLNKREQYHFPPIISKKVPYKLKKAILSYEDNYFYFHPGINPVSMIRALSQNIKQGKTISGASTITMQVARLINPKQRTLGNKILEVLQTFKIEFLYSKEQILKLYIAHAPYGGNIVGTEAAALLYFDKDLEDLTWAEAATLAVLPNSPALISPMASPELLEEKRNLLLEKLCKKKIIDEETYQLALLEDITLNTLKYNFEALHFTRNLQLNKKDSLGAKLNGKVQSTINYKIQKNIENIVNSHVRYLNNFGIRNIAIVVAETKSGKVRSYIGSQDFYEDDWAGKVDGVMAPRSSGSLLKPFLYALCIDKGIVLPDSLIKDVPSNYYGFSPVNANMTFTGLVSMRDALIRSLNVPAAEYLRQYGLYSFYDFLKQAGITTLFRSSNEYGLPLIIGGCEVNLFEMVMLYRGLGNLGRFSPLVVLENENLQDTSHFSRQLISKGAAYLVLECIKDLKRPGSEFYWQLYSNQKPIGWKTGTSYGLRDAWALATNPKWTIGIWVGNFSGEGNPNLKGFQCAAPVLFDILNSLEKNNTNKNWFEMPKNDMKLLKICIDSGYPAHIICENTRYTQVPKNFVPILQCPFHKKATIDINTGYEVCSRCWKTGEYEQKLVNVYPPDVVQCYRNLGKMIEQVPAHNPECSHTQHNNPLDIIYPQNNAQIWVPKDFNNEYQKIFFQAAHVNRDIKVFWYLDENYLGYTIDKHYKSIELDRGPHKLVLLDENGNSRDCIFDSEKR